MRTFIFGFLLFLVYASFSRWYFVCEIRNHCGEQEIPRLRTLSLMQGDTIILEGYEQFAFDKAAIEPVLTDDNREFLKEVAAYLKQNSDAALKLTGRYFEDEKMTKTGIFENLGIARAATVRQYLQNLDIREERVFIDYEMVKSKALPEPVSFKINEEAPGDYANLSFTFKNMTFSDANFEFNSAVFRPGEQCLAYADSVKTYLEGNPETKLTIIGHTDDVGSPKYNQKLGLARAKSAAEYFRELGVTAQIEEVSKGETEPVAPNKNPDNSDNPEGRQKNRRVNFILNPRL
jgi:outer membrane protein OmpA-like peptidoglycan-associated protein